jgi:hypothetical protein
LADFVVNVPKPTNTPSSTNQPTYTPSITSSGTPIPTSTPTLSSSPTNTPTASLVPKIKRRNNDDFELPPKLPVVVSLNNYKPPRKRR